jgi:hypothetical protein
VSAASLLPTTEDGEIETESSVNANGSIVSDALALVGIVRNVQWQIQAAGPFYLPVETS